MTEKTTTIGASEFDRLAAELERANLRYAEVEHTENEAEFEQAADRRSDAEDALLDWRPEFLASLCASMSTRFAILKRRAVGGFDVSEDLAKLAVLALTGLGLVLVPTELV